MNAGSLHAFFFRDQPEKESKREEKKRHGVTNLLWVRPVILFLKGILYLSHKWYCVYYLLSLEACETFYDPPLIKAAQPENLVSLKVFFLYISNLCQPQKVSNKVTFLAKQRCSNLQQRKNQLAQKSDVVNFKATTCFFYIPIMLTNALPGVQWIRDMGTWQQALAQQWNLTPALF